MAPKYEWINCPICSQTVKGKRGLARHIVLKADAGDKAHQEARKPSEQTKARSDKAGNMSQEGEPSKDQENDSNSESGAGNSEIEDQSNKLFLEGSMPKIVESQICPTCGSKHGTVQKFEVPTIPVLSSEGLDEFLKNLDSKIKQGAPEIQSGLSSIKSGIDKGNQVLNALAQAFVRHPKPTEEFIKEHWEDCPECQDAWEKIKAGIVAKGGQHLVNPDHIKDCPECQKVIASMLTPPAPAPEPGPASPPAGENKPAAEDKPAEAPTEAPAEAPSEAPATDEVSIEEPGKDRWWNRKRNG